MLSDDDIVAAARVVLVSFVREGMESWQEERAGVSGERRALVLVDEERTVYGMLGMGRGSNWAIWHPRVLAHYAHRVWRGLPLYDVAGDPNQLGGDVIVAPDGRLLMARPQRGPIDRPTLEEMKEALYTDRTTRLQRAAGPEAESEEE